MHTELGELGVPETITELSEVPVAVSGKPDKAALLDLLRRQPRRYGPERSPTSGPDQRSIIFIWASLWWAPAGSPSAVSAAI